MPSNARPFSSSASASMSSTANNSVPKATHATCIAVGNVSFVLWLMLTWSFGWTSLYDPRGAPRISFARFARISLEFMLKLVPAPAWNTSTTHWSRRRPSSRTSRHAFSMAPARRASSFPRRAFARAAASLTITCARTRAGCARSPETGKFSTARWVCAPQYAPAGTFTSPSVSFSVRNAFLAMGDLRKQFSILDLRFSIERLRCIGLLLPWLFNSPICNLKSQIYSNPPPAFWP